MDSTTPAKSPEAEKEKPKKVAQWPNCGNISDFEGEEYDDPIADPCPTCGHRPRTIRQKFQERWAATQGFLIDGGGSSQIIQIMRNLTVFMGRDDEDDPKIATIEELIRESSENEEKSDDDDGAEQGAGEGAGDSEESDKPDEQDEPDEEEEDQQQTEHVESGSGSESN